MDDRRYDEYNNENVRNDNVAEIKPENVRNDNAEEIKPENNDNQQNQYNQNGYYGNYNNDSYNYNNNNYNRLPKKDNSKIKKIIAIVAIVIAFIGLGGTAVLFIDEMGEYAKKLTAEMKENGLYAENNTGKDNTQENNNAGENTDGEEQKPISTTSPVTVPEGEIGVVTDVSGIVEAVMPSVVSITSTSSIEGYSVFGQKYEQEISSAGTGFIVGENENELLLATNNHVVEDATAIQVTFCDETTAEVVVKGTDAQADLAVVAVSKKSLKAETAEIIKVASLGDSNSVKVGQIAIAIGNAQGMGQSVTVGYISAKDRKLDMGTENGEQSNSMNFLQTDAAINGGNSGGPLIDINGNVVGINSAKISDTSVEGMCYAIPISTAIPIINELMNRETLTDEERGYLGVSLQDISTEAVQMYNVPDGVYIAAVTANSPADKAGLKEGDIITEINGVSVNTRSAASDKINSYRVGTEIDIVVYRQSATGNGYEKIDIKATLGTAEEAGVEIKNDSNNEGNNNNDRYEETYPDDYYSDGMDDWFNDYFPW